VGVDEKGEGECCRECLCVIDQKSAERWLYIGGTPNP
jgi:hypothetical protein